MEYDTSTFDTDPFEPEPDGTGTIFPFWVPGPNGSGYVELPYTLVQDFTLFSVLREQNIDIWKRKLDWIAERGGMVLLNTHPDYMCFGGKPARDEFPVSYYEELLRYVREKYEGSYWAAHAARSCRATTVTEFRFLPGIHARRSVCWLIPPYEFDNRVRRYAETLAKRGDQVDVVALSTNPFPPNRWKRSTASQFIESRAGSTTSGISGPMRGACCGSCGNPHVA